MNTFIDCYTNFTTCGTDAIYICENGSIKFDMDNNTLVIDYIKLDENKNALNDLISYIIRNSSKKIVISGYGDYLDELNIGGLFYNQKFLNIGGCAVLVSKSITIDEYIKIRGY